MTVTRNPSEAELVAAARTGDERAFAALVRLQQGRVERIVIRMLGPGDDAEDVAQETFIRFHDALNEFRGDASVATYLGRTAINLSLNVLRRRRWKLRRFVGSGVDAAGSTADASPDIGDTLASRQRRMALERALGRLSGNHRAVIICRFLEDYSTRETAEILRIPEGTVMSRLTRALDKLRQDLRASGLEGM